MIGPDLFKLGDPPAPALAPVPPDLFKLVSFGTPSCRQVADWIGLCSFLYELTEIRMDKKSFSFYIGIFWTPLSFHSLNAFL